MEQKPKKPRKISPSWFGQPNGNKQNPGGWKKTDTARYKLEQMLKLTEDEVFAVFKDKSAPLFERKVAKSLISGEWKQLKDMMNQVYGMPKISSETDITSKGEKVGLEVIFKNLGAGGGKPNNS